MRRVSWMAAIVVVSFAVPEMVEAKDERKVDPQAEALRGQLAMGVPDVGAMQRALALHRLALSQRGKRPPPRPKSMLAEERSRARARKVELVLAQVVKPVHAWVRSILARWEIGGNFRRSKIAFVIGRKAKQAADREKREEARRSKRPDEPDEDVRALLRGK